MNLVQPSEGVEKRLKFMQNRNEPIKATSNILQIDDDFTNQGNMTANGFNSSIKKSKAKKVRNEIIELSDTENVSTIWIDKNDSQPM